MPINTMLDIHIELQRGSEKEHREVIKARLRQVLADIEMLQDGDDYIGDLHDANGYNYNPKIGTVHLASF